MSGLGIRISQKAADEFNSLPAEDKAILAEQLKEISPLSIRSNQVTHIEIPRGEITEDTSTAEKYYVLKVGGNKIFCAIDQKEHSLTIFGIEPVSASEEKIINSASTEIMKLRA